MLQKSEPFVDLIILRNFVDYISVYTWYNLKIINHN